MMKTVWKYINVWDNLKKYILLKKLDTYGNQESEPMEIYSSEVISVAIITIVAYLMYAVKKGQSLKMAILFFLIGIGIYYIVKITQYVNDTSIKAEELKKILMIGEDGEVREEWDIKGRKSLLIGKRNSQIDVDIDLSGAEYSALISKQHAIMNRASDDNWYIEDLGSCNGIGMQKRNAVGKYRLNREGLHKVHKGDIIYIANTMLFIE